MYFGNGGEFKIAQKLTAMMPKLRLFTNFMDAFGTVVQNARVTLMRIMEDFDRSHQDVYDQTKLSESIITEKGFKLITIWECQWNTMKKIKQ